MSPRDAASTCIVLANSWSGCLGLCLAVIDDNSMQLTLKQKPKRDSDIALGGEGTKIPDGRLTVWVDEICHF